MGADVSLSARQFAAFRETLEADHAVDFEGLSARYEPGPEEYVFETPGVAHAGLDAEALRDVAAEHAAFLTNWYFFTHVVGDRTPARRAFVRWLEAAADRAVPERYAALAEGVVREWGQLRLTAGLAADGERRYSIRHVDDADVAADALAAHTDPLDAREIGTLDARGRYRPLRTAPSLDTGWRFADLDAEAVYDAVETFYPATVVNWHREREGDLDVDHWRPTAARQTGIYDVVADLPEHAVEWVAGACCEDSQCLKRREWELDADEPLDADGGDGVFPCREPCSLVVAAARTWTTLEAEAPRTYSFELTPSEKEQLEDLIDAVADGRVDEIREADLEEGANRYRTRYLREKRVDADGTLSGVPTHPPDDGSRR